MGTNYEETKSELIKKGFTGFKTVDELWKSTESIPKKMGVYVVLYPHNDKPEFKEIGCCGTHKGKNPNVKIEELENNWVENEHIIYIGKAGARNLRTTLARRIKQYLTAGKGENHSHWGGRYIWQIANPQELIFAWKVIPTDAESQPKEVESKMIQEFKAQHEEKRPFANLIG